MADLEGVTTFVNPQMARMLGCTPAEIVGRPVFDFVSAEDHSRVRRHFAQFLGARAGQEVEERLRRKDGTELWTLVAASVFRDRRNQPIGFLGMFTDVTERRRIEAALRRSEARLQLQISRMPIPYIVWDAGFHVVSWNPAAEKLFGFSEAEALGKHPYELIVPREAQPQVDAVWQRLLQGDATASSVNANTTKRDEKLLCEWFNTPLREGDGSVAGVLSMVQDITERQRIQEALRLSMETLETRVQERTAELRLSNQALAESEEKYRRLFDSISDAAVVFDAQTRRFVEANAAALRLYGYTREEFLQLTHAATTVEPKESEASIRLILSGAAPRIPVRYHRKKDGTVFPVEIAGSTFTLKGRPVVCGIIRDITERQQAEEAVARTRELEREILAISEREQQRLGRDLHDDLCQQLAGISFLSERLVGKLAARDAAAAEQAKEIARMLQRAMAQTRDLARGLFPVGLGPAGLADALHELAARTKRIFQLDCCCRSVGPNRVPGAAAAFHLYRIAQEAVGNAVKHSRARRIEIELSHGDHAVTLTVRDDGIGLRRRARAGKGLGLRIMQYRAEVLSGTLTVNAQPGGGTAVVCTIPAGPPSGPGGPK